MHTDPIADFLTRVRNAQAARHASTTTQSSKIILALAALLKDEGYITNFKVLDQTKHRMVQVDLKYRPDGMPVIDGLRRESKPGRRVYVGVDEIPKILGGLGVAILSTSKGVVSDRQARKEGVGGEFLCSVW